MTTVEREAFLAERKKGIGGSDAASLLQPYIKDVRYGCRRRLWYDKSGIPADYPQDDTGPMRLGRILEPHIADWHCEATGDKLSQPELIVHPRHPELLVHIDRIVTDTEHDEPGDAEIKALGPDMFWQTKREGLIIDYVLQLHHGNLCSGHHWGKFIIGDRAYGGKPLAWTQTESRDIQEAILREGPAFWKTLGDESKSPPRLEPDDKRCGRCQWRRTCQGNALMSDTDAKADLPQAGDLLPILIEYDEIAAKFCRELPDGTKGTDDDLRFAEVKEKLKSALGDRQAVAVPFPGAKKDRRIYFRQQAGRTSWNTDDLAQRYEEMRIGLRQRSVIGQDRLAEMEALRDLVADAILYGEEAEAREHARSMASIGRSILDRRDQFDVLFPPAESFRRQGVPFRALRIY